MDAARKDCELYTASASAQQAIQYAIPALEKQALQNRLALIQQASENLDALVATTAKMLEAHNMTRPMAFALQTTKIKLEADRADTQSKNCFYLRSATQRQAAKGSSHRKTSQRR